MNMQAYKELLISFFRHPETKFILPSAILYCGIMIFAGSLIMVGFGVAPTVFKVLPSKDLAGMANQSILLRMIILQGASLLIMAVGLLLLRTWSSVIIRKSIWFVYGLIMFIFVIYGFFIQQTMFSLIPVIGSFDHPLPSGIHALEQFSLLHKLYSFLSSLAAMLAFALMIVHMYANRRTVPKEQDH